MWKVGGTESNPCKSICLISGYSVEKAAARYLFWTLFCIPKLLASAIFIAFHGHLSISHSYIDWPEKTRGPDSGSGSAICFLGSYRTLQQLVKYPRSSKNNPAAAFG